MLPYASYLRVYEPIGALDTTLRDSLRVRSRQVASSSVTLESEQLSALMRVVTASALTAEPEESSGAYMLRRDDRTYFCPVDLPLRSWLSLTTLINSIGDATAQLIFSPDALATASEGFLRWRRDHPEEVAHIRQSTWGIPRTWFVMVVDDERETYDAGQHRSLRYRARIPDARRRLSTAHRILRTVIEDDELLDELLELNAWLESFDSSGWVELDYAGVATLMSSQLASDQSAREVHRAVDALRRRDFAAAGSAYRSFEERWRLVNACERAN